MSLSISFRHYQSHFIVFGVVVATVALIAGLAAISSSSGQSSAVASPTSTSRLAADQTTYDFGTISMAAGKVNRNFTISNTTSDTLTISKLSTSCMCTSAAIDVNGSSFGPFGMPGHGIIPTINQPIGPGETATVRVTFDPAAHGPSGVGRIVRNVFLDGINGERLALTIMAIVKP